MQPIDVQREYNRVSQAYREMRDEELENVAAEAYDLTDVARECLSFEISSRGLKIPLNLTAPTEEEFDEIPPSDDGFVPNDDDLSIVEWAADLNELSRTKAVLDTAQIECFLGEEKVHDPKELSSTFEGGLIMRVFRAEVERARQALRAEIPGYAESEGAESPDADLRCPKCKSDGVIFEECDLEGARAARNSKFRWRCDDCGYEWQDDGVTP